MIFFVKTILRWFLVSPFRVIAQILPVSIIYLLGKVGSKLYYTMAKEVRVKIEEGFRGLVGKDGNYDIKQVVRRCFDNYIWSELEVFLYRRMTSKNIERFVEVKGIENLDRALEEGKGAILLHAHFGNAHMLMPGLGHRGYKVNQVGLSPTDPNLIDDLERITTKRPDSLTASWFRLKEHYEKTLPVRFIYLGRSIRPAIECLQKNEILAISIDGIYGDMISVPFLNKKAFFLTGPIRLAMRTGAAIIPTFTVRKKDGTYRLILEHKIGCNTIENGVKGFISILEGYFKRYPCHYVRLLVYETPPFGRMI